MTNPTALRWGYYGVQLPRAVYTHTHPLMTAANARSISCPGGTVGWLWNLRSEQGSWTIHAATRWARHTSAATSGPSITGRSQRLATRMDHWTTRIPATTRTTTARLPLLQLLCEPGRTHNGSPSQLKVSSTIDGPSSNPKPSIGTDKSQDGQTQISLRPTSTAFFQSCRFSTNQDMSQDGPTRMGATGLNERKHLEIGFRSVPDSVSHFLDRTNPQGLTAFHVVFNLKLKTHPHACKAR